jgi:hypothetical protein
MADQDKEYVVPAQPGWFVLEEMIADGDAVELHQREIIAWKITVSPQTKNTSSVMFPEPVTIDSRAVGDDFVILSPAGRVTKPEEGSWDSLDSYKQELRRYKKQNK